MLEARNQDNKLFQILCMKYPDYDIKIIESCMTLDLLEGTRTRRDFIYSSVTKDMKQFTYRNPFGIHFRYRH